MLSLSCCDLAVDNLCGLTNSGPYFNLLLTGVRIYLNQRLNFAHRKTGATSHLKSEIKRGGIWTKRSDGRAY